MHPGGGQRAPSAAEAANAGAGMNSRVEIFHPASSYCAEGMGMEEGGKGEQGEEGSGREAVVVFARVPEEGAVKRRLAASVGTAQALRFYRACCAHVLPPLLSALHRRGAVCFVFWTSSGGVLGADEARMRRWLGEMGVEQTPILCQQDPSPDLGHRMFAALTAVAQRGFSRIVIVGTDIPDLSPVIVESALGALHEHHAVFGPAADGGYYLLGVQGPQVPAALFQSIPWSTDAVLAQSLGAAAHSGLTVAPLRTLPTLRDVDTFHDLKAWHAASARGAAWGMQGAGPGAAGALLKTVAEIVREKAELAEALAETGYLMSTP